MQYSGPILGLSNAAANEGTQFSAERSWHRMRDVEIQVHEDASLGI